MAYTHTHHTGIERVQPAFSMVSILAVICALASFFFGAGLGLILAIAAIVLGVVGMLAAFSPSVRGGVASMVSVVAGVIGIIAAFIKLLF